MKEKKDKSDDMRSIYSWMGIGIEFAIIVVFFTYLGKYLDKFQDTYPGFMIMGFFVGFSIEMHVILKRAGIIGSKKDKDQHKNNSKD